MNESGLLGHVGVARVGSECAGVGGQRRALYVHMMRGTHSPVVGAFVVPALDNVDGTCVDTGVVEPACSCDMIVWAFVVIKESLGG